ncbi:urea carboxylase-associated family protein [Pseudoroseicyclus sp. CXY001]|uniref:urea carboxylase-associated family protein n=1 Tax=Pseudoroseicyclus sp. CXY001 TaxID=3242492 RepID=UPI00358DBF1E
MTPATRPPPEDADARRAAPPVTVYGVDALAPPDLGLRARARAAAVPVAEVIVPPREGRAVRLAAGQILRISCPEGPQVGDLNLFAAEDLSERFYSGKTRALHGTHLGMGDRLWSSFPALRPMATIIADSLSWYGTDAFGCRVHDVIGTRCDPYTEHLLTGRSYHHCCHSNLTRALVAETGMDPAAAEPLVHDVLNLFMCTGFDAEGRYVMKASPVRAGDAVEFFAEIDLLALLSTCPGGDCSASHSSDEATCYPLKMEVLAPPEEALAGFTPAAPSSYDRSHGL